MTLPRFLLLLLMCDVAVAEDCDVTLPDVLDRYLDARGGGAAIERQQALRIRSKHHEGKWNPDFDYRVMKPGFMWIRATYRDGAEYVEGFDGERGWEMPPGEPAKFVSGAAGRALNQGAQSPVHLYGLHHMRELGATVTLEGCRTIDETGYFVVNVVSRFDTDIDYYLNRDTFLLERARTTRPLHPTIDPTPITIEERWSDFRSVDGVLHPFGYSQWNVDSGERLSWLEIYSIENDREASVETFARPGG